MLQPVLSAGETIPDFQLPDLQGESVSIEEYRGKPTLLFFWGSW